MNNSNQVCDVVKRHIISSFRYTDKYVYELVMYCNEVED